MKIRNIRHKGLMRFRNTGSAAGIPGAVVAKVALILSFLDALHTEDELRRLPIWKPHQLTGDRADTWALHVTKNWRITFQIDPANSEIIDLDYEDYH